MWCYECFVAHIDVLFKEIEMKNINFRSAFTLLHLLVIVIGISLLLLVFLSRGGGAPLQNSLPTPVKLPLSTRAFPVHHVEPNEWMRGFNPGEPYMIFSVQKECGVVLIQHADGAISQTQWPALAAMEPGTYFRMLENSPGKENVFQKLDPSEIDFSKTQYVWQGP